MVRMSDLARRAAGEPAPPTSPPLPPPAGAAPTAPVPRELEAGPGPADDVEPPEILFAELLRFLAGVRDVAAAGERLRWGTLESLVARTARSVASSADLFWIANDPGRAGGVDRLAFHQARVAVLALRLAAGAGHDADALVTLGMAGCLIDVGLWQLPDRVACCRDGLTREEHALYESHPRLSAALVQRWGPPSRRLVDAILQHHEREKGQGFPQALQGPAIAGEAKLLGLADTYATLTAPAPPTPRLRPHEAVREIVKSRADEFPAPLVKALLTEVSVFPPGTLVRLSTEEIARVTGVNRHHPLRPRVEVVMDGRGRPLPAPRAIDLSESPFLYITGAVTEANR
jgi:hypothetical protein